MFKNIIAPVQAWLLVRGQCVGCGKKLLEQKGQPWKQGEKKITCECGRIFIYESKTRKYRRALIEEV